MQQRTGSKCLKVKKQLSMQMSQMNIEHPIFIIFPSHHHCLINSTVYMYFEFVYLQRDMAHIIWVLCAMALD